MPVLQERMAVVVDTGAMNWDDLKIALAVARGGTLSAAARKLGTTQPTVGRRLDALERRLGAPLFERQADGLKPTPLGQSLLLGLAQMEAGAHAVQRQVAARDTGLNGEILVTSLDWLGDEVLAPMLARFGALHPGLAIELVNEGRIFNLARREADLAFRFGAFEQENLVERRVGSVRYALYASQAYLREQGSPELGNGLRGHRIVLLDRGAGAVAHESWLPAIAHSAQVVLRANGLRAHMAAVREGAALAVLPCLLGDREQTLRRLALPELPLVRTVRVGLHADLRDNPRIRALLDFVVREFARIEDRLNPQG